VSANCKLLSPDNYTRFVRAVQRACYHARPCEVQTFCSLIVNQTVFHCHISFNSVTNVYLVLRLALVHYERNIAESYKPHMRFA